MADLVAEMRNGWPKLQTNRWDVRHHVGRCDTTCRALGEDRVLAADGRRQLSKEIRVPRVMYTGKK